MTDEPEEKLDNIYAAMDRLMAEAMANRIICLRMWGYFAMLAAQAERASLDSYIQKQRLESIQSVDLWTFEGHRNPAALKEQIKTSINVAFNGLIQGASGKSQIQ